MVMRHDPIDPGQHYGVERPAFPERVGDRMRRPALTIGWDEPVARAARLMDERHIRHLPVVDVHRRLVGIVTDGDLREALAAEGVREASMAPATLIVGKTMTADVVAVTPSCPLADAVALMRDRKLSALPVVDHDEVVGILTEHDILRAFAETMRG
ncbi:MAG: CBS domain-containing protein [Candidatus Rokubacteria bacterium]|nr:CBS domain-containing protein [Candidatus Rokubacteria bacterium]